MANTSTRGFAQDSTRASEAGKKGGENSHGGQKSAKSAAGKSEGGKSSGNKSSGGKSSAGKSGNFADNPAKAAEAGRKGGKS